LFSFDNAKLQTFLCVRTQNPNFLSKIVIKLTHVKRCVRTQYKKETFLGFFLPF